MLPNAETRKYRSESKKKCNETIHEAKTGKRECGNRLQRTKISKDFIKLFDFVGWSLLQHSCLPVFLMKNDYLF